MKLDILAFGAHPDDVELGCSGTLIQHIKKGRKAGIIDLSQGELGTRGSAELRMKEAKKAAKILGVEVRDNLKMADGFFVNDKEHQLEVIRKIREYKPEIVMCNAVQDRHPDHGRASTLVSDACFYSGLIKISTELGGKTQEAWRPRAVYFYIQDRFMDPDLVVDITESWDKKLEAVLAFGSQFYKPGTSGPKTPISSPEFMEFIKGRALNFGRLIHKKYGEGFITERSPGVTNLFNLL